MASENFYSRLKFKLIVASILNSDPIKQAWESKHSVVKNLESMGLAYDPNKAIRILEPKVQEPITDSDDEIPREKLPDKTFVAEGLEKEAKLPRQKMFRLPNSEVQFIEYMMDTYGEDYKVRITFYVLTFLIHFLFS